MKSDYEYRFGCVCDALGHDLYGQAHIPRAGSEPQLRQNPKFRFFLITFAYGLRFTYGFLRRSNFLDEEWFKVIQFSNGAYVGYFGHFNHLCPYCVGSVGRVLL